jgi:hypothetical protein
MTEKLKLLAQAATQTSIPNAAPIVIPVFDNLLWGVIGGLQRISIGIVVLAIIIGGLGILFSGDDVHGKNRLVSIISRTLIASGLVFGATTIATVARAYFGG